MKFSGMQKLGINLMLCIASVSIFFGGGELLARIKYTPEKIVSQSTFEFDKDKLFRWKKNYQGDFDGVPYTTNSYGHRGPKDIAVAKPENTKRILLLGDSVTFGHGVRDNETFAVYLEEMLNEHYRQRGENIIVQPLNTGSPGNATFQEYHDLLRGLDFNPDAIVLQFTLNDVIIENGIWPMRDAGLTEIDNSQLQYLGYLFGVTSAPKMLYIDYVLRQNSAFYLFLKDMYTRIHFKDPTGENAPEIARLQEGVAIIDMILNPDHPKIIEKWENAIAWIQKIVDIAKEEKIPFILMATPWDFQFNRGSETAYPQKILAEYSKEQNVPYIDLLQYFQRNFAFSQAENPRDVTDVSQVIVDINSTNPDSIWNYWYKYFNDNCHPSPRGHRVIANILKPIILKAWNTANLY